MKRTRDILYFVAAYFLVDMLPCLFAVAACACLPLLVNADAFVLQICRIIDKFFIRTAALGVVDLSRCDANIFVTVCRIPQVLIRDPRIILVRLVHTFDGDGMIRLRQMLLPVLPILHLCVLLTQDKLLFRIGIMHLAALERLRLCRHFGSWAVIELAIARIRGGFLICFSKSPQTLVHGFPRLCRRCSGLSALFLLLRCHTFVPPSQPRISALTWSCMSR